MRGDAFEAAARATTKAAAKIPKIAPDAPAVRLWGESSSAPKDPASSEAK